MTRHAPTPLEIKRLLDTGVPDSAVVHLLVETGFWSKAGAESIIASLSRTPDFLAHGADPVPVVEIAAG